GRNDVVAIVDDLYGGTIERSTLVARLMESLGLAKTTAHMRVKRLVDKGLLLVDGDRVVSPSASGGRETITPVTHSHIHTGVGGVSDVNGVTAVNNPVAATPVTTVTAAAPESGPWADDLFAAHSSSEESLRIKPLAHYDYDCPF
ncbi:MAG: hypothetical protein IIX19_00980, partial [Alistipes sp.]|nr:hypothetical protein [Alistipes sp.]